MLQLSIAESLARLARDNKDFVRLIEQTGFDIGLYRPELVDAQSPHARDEIYVVAAGSGKFVCDGERSAFVTGDVFFVAAGSDHRFERFTPDFCAWVIFIGKRP